MDVLINASKTWEEIAAHDTDTREFYPIGTTFIDLVCCDFQKRQEQGINEENPLVLQMRNDLQKDNLQETADLLKDYYYLTDFVLNMDKYQNSGITTNDISARHFVADRLVGQRTNPVHSLHAFFLCYPYSKHDQSAPPIYAPLDSQTLNDMSNELLQKTKGYDFDIFITWHVFNLREALHTLFNIMVINKILVKKCENCGMFFIPDGRIDTKYCNRIAPNSQKTCREIGAVTKYKEKKGENQHFIIFQRKYKKMNARTRNGGLSKEDFYQWSNIARSIRDLAIQDNLSIDEYTKRLDELEKLYS